MPLQWSEERLPNKECGYNHAVAETPLGVIVIEWKGWKDSPAPTCCLPWGDFIVGSDLADTKEQVQTAWDAKAAEVSKLSSGDR